MTLREVRDCLNNVTTEEVLNREVTIALEDNDVIQELLEWCIGEPSENYDPDDENSQEFQMRNEAYCKIVEMLQAPLTSIGLRISLFPNGAKPEPYFIAEGFC